MARGVSGRIVIEINPETKKELYEQLILNDISLKSWFLENVESFLKGRRQLSLSLATSLVSIDKKTEDKRVSA